MLCAWLVAIRLDWIIDAWAFSEESVDKRDVTDIWWHEIMQGRVTDS